MKVAFVLGGNGQGGTETQARLLLDGLERRGVQVDTFLLDGSDGTSGLPRTTTVLGPGRVGGVAGALAEARTGLRLRRALRRGRYDVVHSALARAYVLSTLALVGRRHVRHVSWRRNAGSHLDSGSRAHASLERLALRGADALVSNSAVVAEHWRAFAPGARAEHVVIPNIVAPWRFDPAAAADDLPTTSSPRVVSVGNLRPVKGHLELLQALAEAASRVQLVVVGEGPARPALEEAASRLGVDLVLPGKVEDTRPYLAVADLYVHSSHSEGSSNAIAEAMASGLAVVATDVGGARELLGDTGVLVPVGSARRLVEEMSSLLEDPERRTRLGAAARDRIRERSDPDAVVSAHLQVYGGATCAA
ncbi:glycosyltransferase [Marmoricola sp. URHB0036]|uniref:glycosyltransferase n=1 Tax=Marmoricola sp. URHB0036 TaxID=1298863 RepID=UPI00040E5C70|nr:glycosyltransferase [Marmoricola sp. URHB0036]